MIDNHKEPPHGWPRYGDFWITMIAAIVIGVVNKVMNVITWKYFYEACKEKKNEAIRVAKTEKACDSLFKGIFKSIVAIWGYQVLKNETYLPRELLGIGHLSNVGSNFPTHAWPEGLRLYYLGTMGYYL